LGSCRGSVRAWLGSCRVRFVLSGSGWAGFAMSGSVRARFGQGWVRYMRVRVVQGWVRTCRPVRAGFGRAGSGPCLVRAGFDSGRWARPGCGPCHPVWGWRGSSAQPAHAHRRPCHRPSGSTQVRFGIVRSVPGSGPAPGRCALGNAGSVPRPSRPAAATVPPSGTTPDATRPVIRSQGEPHVRHRHRGHRPRPARRRPALPLH
jgi:hypothetical protein